ncbi:MAG TPA: hypothetical protein VFI70_02900, partial [Nitrososphaeraceae archaeon]|nr:hypothetical protein [Nitrososphaeraceae archaeon]
MILLRIINSIKYPRNADSQWAFYGQSSQGKRIIITPGDLCKLYLCNEKFKDRHITRDYTCTPD